MVLLARNTSCLPDRVTPNSRCDGCAETLAARPVQIRFVAGKTVIERGLFDQYIPYFRNIITIR